MRLYMRIHDKADYAYELEQPVDPFTQLRTGWIYRVFHLRPIEQVLQTGEAGSREAAEKEAKRVIGRLVQREKRAA
jgi:hypothetical protein